MNRYDIFLSYASEDRQEIAAPLTQALIARGLRVWSDERMLAAGAELSRSISDGLSRCSYGVVILSQAYMGEGKYWPRQELQGLMAREEEEGSLIIPIWHKIGRQDVIAFNPPLAGRKALVSPAQSIEEMSDAILRIVQPAVARPLEAEPQKETTAPPRPARRLKARPKLVPRFTTQQAPAPKRARSTSRSLGSPGIRHTVTPEVIRELIDSPCTSLTLSGQTDLSPETAALLAQWPGSDLSIYSFWDITPEVLENLSRWQGKSLSLAFQDLSAELALPLSRWPGKKLEITIRGRLMPEAAAHLAGWAGQDLTIAPDELSTEAAGALSHWQGERLTLRLFPGRLTPEAAARLAAWSGQSLVLSLDKLSAEAAGALSRWRGEKLTLWLFRGKLTPQAAERLAAWQGKTLDLSGSLGPAAAEHLANWQGKVLDLGGVTSFSAAAAKALYRWGGEKLHPPVLARLSSAARDYLRQWGKESAGVLHRRPDLKPAPEAFGFVPALSRVWSGAARLGSERQEPDPPHSVVKTRDGVLGRRRIPDRWRSFFWESSLCAAVALGFAASLLWLLGSSWAAELATTLKVQGELEPAWWRDTLRVLGFMARLVLALVAPVMTAFLVILCWDSSTPLWKDLARDEECARQYRIRWKVLWAGSNIVLTGAVLWRAMGVFFPGFLTLESLRLALAASLAGAPIRPEDGFWHGLLSLPRALLAHFPPHADATGVWLLYLFAYLLGLVAGLALFVLALHLPLAVLTGFDPRKAEYVNQRSLHLELIFGLSVLYLAWCVVLLIWAIAAAIGA